MATPRRSRGRAVAPNCARNMSRAVLSGSTQDVPAWFVAARPRATNGILGLAVLQQNTRAIRAVMRAHPVIPPSTLRRLREFAHGDPRTEALVGLMGSGACEIARCVVVGDCSRAIQLLWSGHDPRPHAIPEAATRYLDPGGILADAFAWHPRTLPWTMRGVSAVVVTQGPWGTDVGRTIWSFACRRAWWCR